MTGNGSANGSAKLDATTSAITAPTDVVDTSGEASTSAPIDRTGWLRRAEVAARLGVSSRQVQRIEEAGELHTHKDERGGCWFDPDEVERLAQSRASAVPGDDGASPDTIDPGEFAALAFARFNAGQGPREVVVELRVEPDRVKELHAKWIALEGGRWIPDSICARIDAVVGANNAPAEIARWLELGVPLARRALRCCPRCRTMVCAEIGPPPARCACGA